MRPSDSQIDALIKLITDNPNAWIHFHCHAGEGRTTMAMAIYDMLHNADKLSFLTIINRQADSISLPDDLLGKRGNNTSRRVLLKGFYQYANYCLAMKRKGKEPQAWSTMCAKYNACDAPKNIYG